MSTPPEPHVRRGRGRGRGTTRGSPSPSGLADRGTPSPHGQSDRESKHRPGPRRPESPLTSVTQDDVKERRPLGVHGARDRKKPEAQRYIPRGRRLQNQGDGPMNEPNGDVQNKYGQHADSPRMQQEKVPSASPSEQRRTKSGRRARPEMQRYVPRGRRQQESDSNTPDVVQDSLVKDDTRVAGSPLNTTQSPKYSSVKKFKAETDERSGNDTSSCESEQSRGMTHSSNIHGTNEHSVSRLSPQCVERTANDKCEPVETSSFSSNQNVSYQDVPIEKTDSSSLSVLPTTEMELSSQSDRDSQTKMIEESEMSQTLIEIDATDAKVATTVSESPISSSIEVDEQTSVMKDVKSLECRYDSDFPQENSSGVLMDVSSQSDCQILNMSKSRSQHLVIVEQETVSLDLETKRESDQKSEKLATPDVTDKTPLTEGQKMSVVNEIGTDSLNNIMTSSEVAESDSRLVASDPVNTDLISASENDVETQSKVTASLTSTSIETTEKEQDKNDTEEIKDVKSDNDTEEIAVSQEFNKQFSEESMDVLSQNTGNENHDNSENKKTDNHDNISRSDNSQLTDDTKGEDMMQMSKNLHQDFEENEGVSLMSKDLDKESFELERQLKAQAIAALDFSEPSAVDVDQDEEEDSWDKMFDDNGDCLDPSVMEELTQYVGKVKIDKPKIDYLNFQPKEPDMDMELYRHVIEIYDFPGEFLTRDLITAFKDFMSRGFDIKWVDDTHALGVFASPIAAEDALRMRNPFLKVRSLGDASKQSKSKARKNHEFLQPYKPRPQTSASAARRLVSGALGLQAAIPREKRELERKQLKEAKEKRRKERRQKQDMWDGAVGKCAMDQE